MTSNMSVLVAFGFMLIALVAEARVQCSCPTISAEGEGQTSCSASESGGKCTIDFNLFGAESEKRAADLLKNNGARTISTIDPRASTFDAMRQIARMQPENVQGLILVYLTVALGNQSARYPSSVNSQAIKEIATAVGSRNRERSIAAAFSEGMSRTWSSRSDDDIRRDFGFQVEESGGVTLSPGCVEYTTRDGTWVMFKMAWAAARVFPRCSPPSRR